MCAIQSSVPQPPHSVAILAQEAETEELERQRLLERLDAAMARGQEAEHERQQGETALWHQRTQETLRAIRDEPVQVEAARIARGYGVRLVAEEGGTLAAKVRTFVLDQAAEKVDQRDAARFPTSSARRAWNGGQQATEVRLSLCFCVCESVEVSVASVAVL